jgi:hypothetical protein
LWIENNPSSFKKLQEKLNLIKVIVILLLMWNYSAFILLFLCGHVLIVAISNPFGAKTSWLVKSNLHKKIHPEPYLPANLNKLQYHGTTTLSFKHRNCVIVCVDSKASLGDQIGSTSVKKVFPIAKSIVGTMAGGAADCAFWITRTARIAKMIQYKYSARITAGNIANILSSSLRENKGAGKEKVYKLSRPFSTTLI